MVGTTYRKHIIDKMISVALGYFWREFVSLSSALLVSTLIPGWHNYPQVMPTGTSSPNPLPEPEILVEIKLPPEDYPETSCACVPVCCTGSRRKSFMIAIGARVLNLSLCFRAEIQGIGANREFERAHGPIDQGIRSLLPNQGGAGEEGLCYSCHHSSRSATA